jgi:hypothetical protein
VSHNPYTPPEARVEQRTPRQPLARPAVVLVSVVLLYIPVLINVVRLVPMFEDYSTGVVSLMTLVITIAAIVIQGWLSYMVFVGRNWARFIVCVLIVLGNAATFVSWREFVSQPTLQTLPIAIVAVLELTAVALLFTSPARRWFARRREAV